MNKINFAVGAVLAKLTEAVSSLRVWALVAMVVVGFCRAKGIITLPTDTYTWFNTGCLALIIGRSVSKIGSDAS